MVLKHRNRAPRPKTFCPKCHQRGVVTVHLPEGATVCFRCLREYMPTTYQDLHNWLTEHPPIQKT